MQEKPPRAWSPFRTLGLMLLLLLGVGLGAIFFPRRIEVTVERIVEKRVEVPVVKRPYYEGEGGVNPLNAPVIGYPYKKLFAANHRMVSVHVYVPDEFQGKVSAEDISARVKSVLRREGFQVFDGGVETEVHVSVDFISVSEGNQLCGTVNLEVQQQVSVGRWGDKSGWRWVRGRFQTWRTNKLINYGSKNYHMIPELFDSMTLRLAQDLIDAEMTKK